MIKNLTFFYGRNYLAPNYSYDDFVKAYKCKLEKDFFPYYYFDSYNKLHETKLPSHFL